jgi:hypothetical protein
MIRITRNSIAEMDRKSNVVSGRVGFGPGFRGLVFFSADASQLLHMYAAPLPDTCW